MKELYLKADMADIIKTMRREEIEQQLALLGCTLTYQDIYEKLTRSYNDLAVADEIFQTQTIDDTTTRFPKTFIDEAVLEIARRESFAFTHYGLLSDAILDLLEKGSEHTAEDLLTQFRLLFKTAQKFHMESLEAMMYQVNDGVDMIRIIMMLLDQLMEQGRQDAHAYQTLIAFADKFLKVFPKTSERIRVGLLYEQAQAYIALKSKKGEQIFLNLLKTHGDRSDVVLHYALAYLNDDERHCARILQRYDSLLDKESPAYEAILDLRKEVGLERKHHV